MNQRHAPKAEEILSSPCTHNTLKRALQAFLEVDPVDAANDSAILAEVLAARLQDIQGGAR